MKPLVQIFVIGALVAVLAVSASATVPPMINYQGKLATPSGALIVADTVTMEFKIYNDSTGGTILWQETQNSVKVEHGIFNVLLGSVNPIPDSVFNGSTRYLGVKVGDDPEMTPRKPMVSVGYAFHSGTADTAYFSMPDADWVINGDTIFHLSGNVGVGTTSPGSKLEIKGSEQVLGLTPSSSSSVRMSIRTGASDAGALIHFLDWDGTSFGTIGKGGACPQGIGFIGGSGEMYCYDSGTRPHLFIASSGNVGIGTTSPAYSLDVNGSGRFYSPGNLYIDGNVGIGTTSPAYKLDVAGDIRSTGTIHGNFDGTINNALLWNGHSWGDKYPDADLLDGINSDKFLRSDQSGTLNGSLTVNGRIDATSSIISPSEIIRAENMGSGQGIFARTHSSTGGSGISGDGADSTASANSFGVAGSTHSPSGEQPPTGSSAGVYGLAANRGNGDAFGVLGRCWTHGGSGNPTAAGVFGWGDVTSGSTYGVWGETGSTQNDVSGVYGIDTAWSGMTRGTIGVVKSTTAGAAGVLGAAPNTGAVRGVMGYCHSASGYAVYSDGNFAVPDPYTKSVIMPVSKGAVKLYCQESPELWFEDFGEGELSNGKSHVELDPLFLETVILNAKYPMKVFVQLNDECNGVFVKRGTTGFDVLELNNGKSNAHFTYRIVAKRKGCETKRLDETELTPYEFTQPLSTTSTRKE